MSGVWASGARLEEVEGSRLVRWARNGKAGPVGGREAQDGTLRRRGEALLKEGRLRRGRAGHGPESDRRRLDLAMRAPYLGDVTPSLSVTMSIGRENNADTPYQ